ncbi:glycosyltransferase involved in cell wall biosynthesis [Azospirillum lipoferum]|uniref:Glycosyltransferase family 2 protein n=1 Tax=Azospirillum lipoferum TaxID=193 RepID=A0A5A9GGV2_AZOLI|nr:MULTISPECIES: glycosyltransferase family 2 protein [Azospirillum]KAA0593557.1 glycosyltransferase family 2 protein [Azospirillum lipoferum]MCP1608976.1 glycosyltransferase involved in cell wall biosynthesis [Azospirillum lipoferum]MDW5535711.1 glycosyltransferase family 2 protein [Azospirillum sp. NL1]
MTPHEVTAHDVTVIPVSVVVMTRNEAANLPRCLPALARFAECFVVDSGSDDGSPDIARSHGARLIPFRWNGRYPKKKQWCLDALPFAHDWVLFVDADERPTVELVEEIARLTAETGSNGPAHAAYWIDGRPVVHGRPLRFGCWNRKLALLHRRHVRFPDQPDLDVAAMWEVEGHYQPQVAGTTGRLRHPMDHEDAKPPSAWFDRHNRYSDWEAALRADGRMERLIKGEPDGGFGVIPHIRAFFGRQAQKRLFQRLPGRPLWAFLHAYVLRLGVFDGTAGLDHALARAFYYWQVGFKMRSAARAPGEFSRVPSIRTVSDSVRSVRPAGDPYSSSSAIRSPPSAFSRSKVRLRTPGSSIR